MVPGRCCTCFSEAAPVPHFPCDTQAWARRAVTTFTIRLRATLIFRPLTAHVTSRHPFIHGSHLPQTHCTKINPFLPFAFAFCGRNRHSAKRTEHRHGNAAALQTLRCAALLMVLLSIGPLARFTVQRFRKYGEKGASEARSLPRGRLQQRCLAPPGLAQIRQGMPPPVLPHMRAVHRRNLRQSRKGALRGHGSARPHGGAGRLRSVRPGYRGASQAATLPASRAQRHETPVRL